MEMPFSKKNWYHHTHVDCTKIDWFDKKTVDLYLDIKEEEIYKLFDDVEREEKQKLTQNGDTNTIAKNICATKIFTECSLQHILNQNWYNDFFEKISSQSYVQEQKTLVIRLVNLLRKEIDWIDGKIWRAFLTDNSTRELWVIRKELKHRRDILLWFAELLEKNSI